MRRSNKLLIIILLIMVLIGGVLVLSKQAKLPRLVSRTDPPRISFEQESHELGTVAEGIEIPFTFKIQNIGGEPLVIEDVTTTCGCTVLELKQKVIEPGKTGDLVVTMDTAMKQGHVQKEIVVLSNDPKNPKKVLYLGANVMPGLKDPIAENMEQKEIPLTPMDTSNRVIAVTDPHSGLTDKGKAKIFTGNCAVCHVQQGKGKLGADLFQADCAMCHGVNAEGAVGPALLPGNYQNPEFAKHIEKIIRFGSPSHLSMPGFSVEAGGPLTDEEIASLMTFLQTRSLEMQQQKHKEPAAATGG